MNIAIPSISFGDLSYNGLIGDTYKQIIYFNNTGNFSSKIGYKGVIDVFIQTGLLNNSNNGFVATWKYYTDQEILNNNYTPGSGRWLDINNNIILDHPYSSSGLSLPLDPNLGTLNKNSYRWYVYDSEYSSYGPSQPKYVIKELTLLLSSVDGMEINNNYNIIARPWFKYGMDALDNPLSDPPILGETITSTINANILRVSKTVSSSEIPSGPNFPFTYKIKIDISKNANINNLILTDYISDFLLSFDPDVNNVNSSVGSIKDSRNGANITKNLANSKGNKSIPPLKNDKQYIKWDYSTYNYNSIIGIGGNDIELEYTVYAPYKSINDQLVLDKSLYATRNVTENVNYSYKYNNTNYNSSTNCTTIIKQLCIQKSVIPDKNIPIPLSLLTYTLNIQLSDYFSVVNMNIIDVLSDGHYIDSLQSLYTNFNIKFNDNEGNEKTYVIYQSDITINDNVTITNINDPNYIINKSIDNNIKNRYIIGIDLFNFTVYRNGIFLINSNAGVASGGLVNYGFELVEPLNSSLYITNNKGKYSFKLIYAATIDQLYYGKTQDIQNINGSNNKLCIGDKINSSVNIYGDLWDWTNQMLYKDINNLAIKTHDNGSTITNIGGSNINKTIYAIKRGNQIVNTDHLQSQDLVTYRIVVELSHQNFLDFHIYDFLPLPIMPITTITTLFNISPNDDLPDINHLKYGPLHTFHLFKSPSISSNTDSNSFDLFYDNYQNPYIEPQNIPLDNNIKKYVIDIFYTFKVIDKPTADGLILTNQGVYSLKSLLGNESNGISFTGIILDQPIINISEGVIAHSNANPSYTSSIYTATVPITCSIGNKSFMGVIDDISKISSSLNNLDRSSKVKYCICIENTGSSTAYDVKIKNTDINTTDYNIDLSTVEMVDGNGSIIDYPFNFSDIYSIDGILIGNIPAKSNESSIRALIFEATLLSINRSINYNQSLTNTTTAINFANTPEGTNFYSQLLIKPTTSTTVSFRNPSINRYITYRSENPTVLTNRTSDNITIGEIFRITSTLTIPIGSIITLQIKDQLNDLLSNTNTSGLTRIHTDIQFSNTSYNSSITGILQNATRSSQYITYYFGGYDNNSIQDETIIIKQYLIVSDLIYNGRYVLGQNIYANRYQTRSISSVSYSMSPSTTFYTSNNVTANIKEPSLNITKSFHPNIQQYSKNDKVIYKINLTSTSQATGSGPRNVVINDDIDTNLTLNYAGTSYNTNNIPVSNNSFNYTVGSMVGNNTLNYYLDTTVNNYQSGNIINNTAVVRYNSIDDNITYISPLDDINVKSIIENYNKIYRSYVKNSEITFKTLPTFDSNIINKTQQDDESNIYSLINGKIGASIGDTLITTCNIGFPKGNTYIKKIIIDTNTNNIIPSLTSIIIDLPQELLCTDSNENIYNQLIINPILDNNKIIFSIEKIFTNDSSSFIQLDVSYNFKVKNNNVLIKGVLNNLLWQIQSSNFLQMPNSYDTINSISGTLQYYIVEPNILLEQSIIQIPLTPNDDYIINLSIKIDDGIYNTRASHPVIIFDKLNIISEIEIISVPSNWISTITDDITYGFVYYGKNNDGHGRSLYPGNTGSFVIRFKLNNSDMKYGDFVTSIFNCWWTSQNTNTDYIIPVSEDDIYSVRQFNNSITYNTINNYNSTSNFKVYIEPSIDNMEFGLNIEDSLDYDYDYNDLTLNVKYTYYRNKKGLRRFIGDFNVTNRGAAYDHTFGLYFKNLSKLCSGIINIYRITGYNENITNDNSQILSYLGRSGNILNMESLRDDCIPIIISTFNILPPDTIRDTFSSNVSNRLPDKPDWIPETTVRLIIDFDSSKHLVTNGLFLMPYIDVRGKYNNKVNPKYNDYEYRHYLNSKTSASKKTFTYRDTLVSINEFPKMIITDTDLTNIKESTFINNTYPFSEAYPEFVNYITNGDYINKTSMVDMTDMRKMVDYIKEGNNQWYKTYNKEKLIMVDKDDYDIEYINNIITSKKMYGEYKYSNIYKISSNFLNMTFSIKYLIPNESSDVIVKNGNNNFNFSDNKNNLPNTEFYDISSKGNRLLLLAKNKVQETTNLIFSNDINNNIVDDIPNNMKKIYDTGNYTYGIYGQHQLYCENKNIDIAQHNNNRKVMDCRYINNNFMISIDDNNNCIITTEDPINKPINNIIVPSNKKFYKLETNNNMVGFVTTKGEVYISDDNGNIIRIFDSYNIESIQINNNYIIGLDKYGVLLKQNVGINMDISQEVIILDNGVYKYNCDNKWVFVLYVSGKISYIDIEGDLSQEIKDIINNYQYISTEAIIDVKILNGNPIICYI